MYSKSGMLAGEDGEEASGAVSEPHAMLLALELDEDGILGECSFEIVLSTWFGQYVI